MSENALIERLAAACRTVLQLENEPMLTTCPLARPARSDRSDNTRMEFAYTLEVVSERSAVSDSTLHGRAPVT